MLKNKNIYEQYIEHLKTKQYLSATRLEKHHVVPVHAGGNDASENLLKLSIEDHILAHQYRYMVYGEKGEKLAFVWRKNDTAEAAILRSQLAQQDRLAKGLLLRFKDSEAQSLLGQIGGKKGGLANTAAQYQARSAVGKVHGKKVGVSNQSNKLKKLLKQEILWEHTSGIKITTVVCNSFKHVCDQLNQAVPNTITNNCCFFKVLYKERPQMYGWRIIDN